MIKSRILRSPYFSFALLAAAFLLLYVPSIGNFPLFIEDDRFTFLFEPLYTGPALEAWLNLVTNVQTREFLPVAWTFIFLEVKLFGHDPAAIRLVSALLHGVNVFLVWRTARVLSGEWFVSLGVALLFCILPVNVESTLLVANQFGQLSVMFGLSALLCVIYSLDPDISKRRSRVIFIMGLLFFLSALLCKSGITVLPVVVFLIFLLHGRRRLLHSLRNALPFFLVAVLNGMVAILLSFNEFPILLYPGGNPLTSILSHLPLFLRSIWNFYFPILETDKGVILSLSFMYPFEIADTAPEILKNLLSGLLGLMIIASLWLLAGRTRPASLGALWFLSNQAFYSGALPGQWWPLADRYLYFGSFGLCLLTILALSRILKAITRAYLKGILVFTCSLYFLFLFSLAGYQRDIWLSELKSAHQQRLVLGRDSMGNWPEIKRFIEIAILRLQKMKLSEPVDDWAIEGAGFEAVRKFIGDPDTIFNRSQNEYYLALAMVAIHESRTGNDSNSGERLLYLSHENASNPYIALYSALYLAGTGRLREVKPYLDRWRAHPLARYDQLRRRIARKPAGNFPLDFIVKGNYIANLEAHDNYWLFFELDYRYNMLVHDVQAARETERTYKLVYPPIWERIKTE